MWYILLLLPTLLYADVMVDDAIPTPVQASSASAQDNAALTQAVPSVATPIVADNMPVALRLRPSLSAPSVHTLPLSQLAPRAIRADSTDGLVWYSVEEQVTLTGYVAKADIQKDLEITRGAKVWSSPDKSELLTTIDDPAFARLLDVDRMGRVEVKEPRVLYYTQSTGPQIAPVARSTPRPSDTTTTTPVEQNRRGSSLSPVTSTHHRTIQAVLKQTSVVTGRRFYLVDSRGVRIANISPNSPIDRLTLQRYLGQPAIFTGDMISEGGQKVFTVRSIRLH